MLPAEVVDAGVRRTLAEAWNHVLVRVAQPSAPIDPRAPLARADARAASGEIAELAAALRPPPGSRRATWPAPGCC